MTQLLTHSRLSTFRTCPRRHQFRYEIGLAPEKDDLGLRVGTAFHAAKEAQDLGRDPVEAINALGTLDIFDAAMVAAMVTVHTERWAGDTLEVIATEIAFDLPLVNPETGAKTPVWRMGGKVDRIYRLRSGVLAIQDYKGLALDTPIPTPHGWTTMGQLQVGDDVFDTDGKSCKVVSKSSLHNRKCYRIKFDDGSSVVCDDEHNWLTTKGNRKKDTAVRTAEEVRRTLKKNGQCHHRVKVAGALQTTWSQLPISPYVLGCWIGDGTAACGRISKPDDELFTLIRQRGYEVGEGAPSTIARGCPTRTVYGLGKQLRALNLLGNKHIPNIYLRASEEQRLDLLRGLMDTDGTWNHVRSQAVFTSIDKKLAEDVCELALSLSQRATVQRYKATGFGKTLDAYRVVFRPCGINPFLLSRKADKVSVAGYGRSRVRVITEVEEVPTVTTQCISVDSPSRTYLCTKAMIPTHNTTSEDIAPDADIWLRLALDQQMGIYVMAARELGYDVQTILYDVTKRPMQRPQKATPEAERKYTTKDSKLADGTIRPAGSIYANQRERDETPEEFAARVAEAMRAEPEKYFARFEIARLDKDLDETSAEIWQQQQAIREMQRSGRWYRNPSACVSPYRCPYLAICNRDPQQMASCAPDGYRLLDDVHPELAATK